MLQTTNKKIVEFYKQNENIGFDEMNILMINFIETINNDLNKTLNNTLQQQILTIVNDLNYKVCSLSNIPNDIELKMINIKKEYVDDIKNILTINSHNKSEKISSIIEKNSENILNKTKLFIQEIIPKSQEITNATFHKTIEDFQKNIIKDVNVTLSNDNNNMNNFIKNFDNKVSFMIQNVLNNVSELKEDKNINQKIFENIQDFLIKTKHNSSIKGGLGQNKLLNILNQAFPNAEVIDTNGVSYSGDIMLKRTDLPNIMLENKEYDEDTNVPLSEITKFIRDVENVKTHSIFLSQKGGISTKNNFEIDFHNNKYILIYIHFVNYDFEKIKMAINIIDALNKKIEFFTNEDNNSYITESMLKKISDDFIQFIKQKNQLLTDFKEYNKKIIKQIEDLTLSNLENYLSDKCANAKKEENIYCEICQIIFYKRNDPKFQTKMSAHKRGCKHKVSNENEKQKNKLLVNLQNIELNTVVINNSNKNKK